MCFRRQLQQEELAGVGWIQFSKQQSVQNRAERNDGEEMELWGWVESGRVGWVGGGEPPMPSPTLWKPALREGEGRRG